MESDESARLAETERENEGVASIQFGTERFVYGEAPAWQNWSGQATRNGRTVQQGEDEVAESDLHLVVQKGRLFEMEHPEAKVLFNKGRYLVVAMPPEDAERLGSKDEPCFSIEPLKGKSVAFSQPALRAAAPIDWIQELLARVTVEDYLVDLARLVAFETRHSFTDHYLDAANLMQVELRSRGFSTQIESVAVGSRTTYNIIADKSGSLAEGRGLVIAMAHLDSINSAGVDENSPAPGADDNGSGSAGILTLARVFENHNANHDLRLLLFGGEEEGLFGSKAYVNSLPNGDRQRLIAALNMDMIGSMNTDAPTVLLEGAPVSADLISQLSSAAATYTSLAVQTSLQPYASDHVPFIEENLAALLTIEGADGANGRIHTANDTLEHVSGILAQQILKMNAAGIASWLGRDSPE